jgi:hypothetical protein
VSPPLAVLEVGGEKVLSLGRVKGGEVIRVNDVWDRPPGGEEGLLYRLLHEIRRRRMEAEGRYTLAADTGDRYGAIRWVAVGLALADLESWVAARAQR